MRRRVLCAFVWTFLFCALMPLASADSFPLYKGLGPGALADYVNAAITAIQKGDLDTAEKALLNAMVLAPNEPHAMALLAEVEMRRGRPANALKYLQANIQRNPTSAVPEEAMGRYLAERKDYSGAESALKKSVGLDPMWVDARLSLGDLYLSQRKFAEALATYRSAVQLAPNSGSAHLSLASGLAAAGNSQSSESELRNAIRLMPQSARAHVALGNLLSLKGTDDVAIGEYETAIKLEPGNSGTYNLIGMAQKKQGRTNLAEQAYRKALALQPNDVVALTNLAWIEMQDPHRVSEALVLHFYELSRGSSSEPAPCSRSRRS